MKKIVVFFLGIIFSILLTATDGKDSGKYRWPLDINNGFSSSFQEFRGNHFHAGLDLRTFQRTGYPVYAISDGTVYRILSMRRGSGNAVFLRHNDGYHSNYFHLEKFAGNIERAVTRYRELKGKKYFGDYYLKPPIEVKRGDILAYSGESGAGFPHLHLEIRDEGNRAVNPFPLLDNHAIDKNRPVLHNIVLRSRGDSLINGEVGETTVKLVNVSSDRSGYEAAAPVVVTGAFDLLLNARDIADTGKKVSPYSVEAKIDGNDIFKLSFDSFAWEDNNQLGFVYDMDYSSSSRYYFNMFFQEGFDLEKRRFPFAVWWEGLPEGVHRLDLKVSDHYNNDAYGSVDLVKLPLPAVRISSVRRTGAGFIVTVGLLDAPGCHQVRLEMLDRDGQAVGSGIIEDCRVSGSRDLQLDNLPGNAVYLDLHFLRNGVAYCRKRIVLDHTALATVAVPDISFQPYLNRDEVFLLVKDFPLPAEYLRLQVIRGGDVLEVAPLCSAGGLYFLFTPPQGNGNGNGDLVLSFSVSNGDHEIAKIQKYLKILLLQDNEPVHFDWKEFSAQFDRRSVRESRVLLAEEKNLSSEFPVLSRQISLSPYNFPFLDTVLYRFTANVENPRQVGIFKYSYGGKKWLYTATSYSSDTHTFSTRRISSGTFALMRDIFPPRIYVGSPSSDYFDRLQILTVRIEDKGKGVDDDSLEVFLNGKAVDCEYDADWQHVKIWDFTHKTMGKNLLVVRVRDRGGNSSRVSHKFYLK